MSSLRLLRCAARIARFSFPSRTYRFGPAFARATPSRYKYAVLGTAGFWLPLKVPKKKSLCDFATLASLGHFALRSA